jgi:hypothetical protein
VVSNSVKSKKKLLAFIDFGSVQRKQITGTSLLVTVVDLSVIKPTFRPFLNMYVSRFFLISLAVQ